MSTSSFEEIIPLILWREYLRHRGFGKPIPEFVLRYLDLVAIELLAIAATRTSDRHSHSAVVPSHNKAPPKREQLQEHVMKALQFDSTGTAAFLEQARHTRLEATTMLLEFLESSSLMELDVAIAESLGVGVDQAGNIRLEAEAYVNERTEFRTHAAEIFDEWLSDRERKSESDLIAAIAAQGNSGKQL